MRKQKKSQVLVEPKQDKSIRVYEREKINIQLKIAQPEWSEKQKELIALVRDKDTKTVMCKGPAGSAKTFTAMYLALELLNIGRIKEIILVRSVVESSGAPIGLLPGTIDEKFGPYCAPFLDKLSQLLPKNQIEFLIKDERIVNMPVNFMRGREFNSAFIIADEAQNFSQEELITILTRYGKFSKMMVLGDYNQSDIEAYSKRKSGFRPFFDWFNSSEAKEAGVHTFGFDLIDIKREPVVAFFVEQYTKFKQALAIGDYRPGNRSAN